MIIIKEKLNLDSGNDMLYGLGQPRLERQFSSPVTKPAESEKTPTTPLARSDLKLSVKSIRNSSIKYRPALDFRTNKLIFFENFFVRVLV